MVVNINNNNNNKKKVTILVVGAGARGTVYSNYALDRPDLCQVVGVADPRDFRRNKMAETHNVPQENVFTDWKQAAARPKFADAVVIATQDAMHVEPAVAFANLGYHILLEKPMAVNEEDCRRVKEAVVANNVIFSVGHVLRYTPYTQTIKSLIKSGALGQIVSIQHLEPVGFYHQAHSYVRGNWRRTDESSFMLMAKSCHDIDWIRYVMDASCVRVSSFGSLIHFRKENMPQELKEKLAQQQQQQQQQEKNSVNGSNGNGNGNGNEQPLPQARCLECPVEQSCAYSAKKIYLDPLVERGHTGFPVSHIDIDGVPDIENVTEALAKGPYGRCVYDCDNDVVDHQVVNMQFANGTTAAFTMVAFSKEVCIRKTRIFGTRGELESLDSNTIRHYDFLTRTEKIYNVREMQPMPQTRLTGHNGADFYLMQAFVAAVANNDPSLVLAGPAETLESHLIVFAAERARLKGTVEEVKL